MRIRICVLIAIFVGVQATLISGLFKTPGLGLEIDVIRQGAPFPWIMRVLPRTSTIIWNGLIQDLVFWVLAAGIVVTVVLFFVSKIRS